jgi:hypothetical protein
MLGIHMSGAAKIEDTGEDKMMMKSCASGQA